ncbi:uncharacterized protein LOC129572481 [Sitodiplosis mosellana]|uniref:uncharacterized protein LOC129572481 n=1 Tax=Sitodiplosis mosellana TaxID=263140 RepID=UPI002444FAA0|nr:uncharacterized protein LOC129572481 [Sitodiplosis mosellana]
MGTPLKNWELFLLLSILSFCVSIGSVQGLQCYVCYSDKLEDCSTLHSIEELPLELCPADVASCFTRIEHGITIRGCLSHREQTLCEPGSCSFCRSNKCNAQIFPEDRLSCLHCEGSICVNQTNTIDVRYPCSNYVADDECYSVFSYDGNLAYRGCMSDISSAGRDFCLKNYAQCDRCNKRACNSEQVRFEEKISCVKCNPDENSNCNLIEENITAIECAPTTLGYKNLCYTLQSGRVAHRGCLYEAPEEIFVECDNTYSEVCLTCNQSDCNRTPVVNEDLALNPFHYEISYNEGQFKLVQCDNSSCTKLNPWERFCYKCDSNINPNCTNELDDTMLGLCDVNREDLGCYHMITDGSGVIRGCVSDLEGEIKQKCLDNDDSCKTCTDPNCNSRANFSQCLVTDEDQSSAWNNFQSLSSPKMCEKYDEKCFIQVIKEDTVIRGCVDTYAAQNDLPSNFLNAVENKRTYEICSGPLCNNKEVEPMYCMTCNSTDENCIEDPRRMYLIKRCRPLEVDHSGCYHFDNGSYVERGCIANLDEKQRAECESNSDECKKCLRNECNSKKQFLKCIWSINEDVSRPSKQCRNYNDECFILVKNATVKRGCLSDWIDSPVPGIDILSDRRNSDIYERCSLVNCNKREIEPEYCLVCSSDDKIHCKYGPTAEMKQKCPMRVKKLGCYLQEGDIVKRGCVSEFSREERHACVNDTCKICKGDTCNAKRSFEVCKTCSSRNDEYCISKPWMASERICPNYMDQCYVHVKKGIVQRNCIGEFFVTTLGECINSVEDCTKSEYCLPCTGYKCNGNAITPEVCIVCDSHQNATCKSISMYQEQFFTQECPLSVEPQGCYHFVSKEDGRHIRGCVSQLSAEERKRYNEKNDEFKICKGPKCNSQHGLERCLICNSTVNPDCATSPNSSYSKVCDNYKNMCFTQILQQEVIRGCLNDLKEASRVKCQYNEARCGICSTSDGIGCNNEPVEMDTCIECDSTDDEGCRLTPKESDQKICAHIKLTKQKGCYLGIVGPHVKRGCIQDLTPSAGHECTNGSPACKSCNWTNCNLKPTFHECYSCNSKNDPRCTRQQSTKTEICQSYHSACTTGIDELGYTHRACDEDTKAVFLKQSKKCMDIKCNYEIFPENRLKCYQCNGNEDCNFMSPNSTDVDLQPQPCGISSVFDQCFTYINKDNKMFRGCLSDSTPIRLECEAYGDNKQGNCVKCKGSGCNDQPKVKQAELSCTKCSDAKECAFGQSLSAAIVCLNDVTFGDQESCFVHTIPGSSTVERGCTLDVNATNWCKEEIGCEKCLRKGCNTQNVRHSWCLRCQSDVKGDCAKISNPNEFIEECDHLPYTYSKRGCYTIFRGGNVTRGCNIDLSEDEYENCRRDDSCELCSDDYCNKEEIINSGVNTSASTLMCLYAILVTYLVQVYKKMVGRIFGDWKSYCLLLTISILSSLFGSSRGKQCYVCTSEESNICSTLVPSEELPIISCPIDISSCFTKSEHGITVRGCLLRQEQSHGSNNSFVPCETNECNVHTFPGYQPSFQGDRFKANNTNLDLNPFHLDVVHEGGNTKLLPCDNEKCTKINSWERSCFKCDTKDDSNCANGVNDSMRQMCPFADEDLGCFHMINDSNVIRGCVVELDESEKQKCLANDDSCKSCFETDGCNRQQSFSECFVTDQPISNLSPPNVFETKSWPKICAKYNDTCFTQVLENDTVIRGCLDEYAAKNDLPARSLSKIEGNNRRYQVCSTPLCNGKQLTASFCYACNSIDKPRCATEPSMFKKKCPLEINPSGCYHFINGSYITQSSYVERGCVAGLIGNQRKNCESNSETCKTCAGNVCNKKSRFQKCRFSVDAFGGRIKTCQKYDDVCYLYVYNNTVRRGCLNELIDEPVVGHDIISDCKNNPDVCEICSGFFCNTRDILRNHCISCTSLTNITCSYHPTVDMKVFCPYTLNRLGCYDWKSIKWGNIFVERGCVTNLAPEMKRECQSSSDTCKICQGIACNDKISFPHCLDCSSEDDDDDCREGDGDERTALNLKTRHCPNYMDQCYTRVENNIVTRNCTDEVVNTPVNCQFDSESCHLCDGLRCNGRSIERNLCVSCDSDTIPNCRSKTMINDETLFREFPFTLYDRGCFHFVMNDTDRHIRGHVSQLTDEQYRQFEATGDEFRICKGAKCNSRPSLPRCLVCNSTEDPKCATNPSLLQSQVCPNYQNRCFTYIGKNNVIRGCLHDMDHNEDFQKKCESQPDKCAICPANDGGVCNNVKLNMETCIECQSSIDPRCRTHPDVMKETICDNFQNKRSVQIGCYLKIDGDKFHRGCIKDLEPASATQCLDNSVTCKSCTEARCNAKAKFQECYGCNGENEPLCAKNTELMSTKICKDYHSSCAIGIDKNGFTHRRCFNVLSNLNKEFPNNTFTCDEDKCNVEIFPNYRLKCYQCNGNEACNLDTSMKPEPCRIYTEYDQCFTYMGEDKEVFRGCLSDSSKERILCERNDKGTCVECSDTGCNNQPKVRQPKLACVNCTGSDECAFGYNASMAVPCKKDVELGDEESCFTRSINGTEHVERGCTLDIDSKLNEEYKTCSEPGCNIGNVRFSWCLRCQSGIDGNCSVIQSPFEYIQHCDHSVYTYDRRGCFTSHQNGIISRGCTADLTEEEYEKCHGDDSCTFCTDDYCNKEKINAGIQVSASLLLCPLAFFSTYIQRIN